MHTYSAGNLNGIGLIDDVSILFMHKAKYLPPPLAK